MDFPASDYLDLNHTAHAILFPKDQPAWAALARIESYMEFRLQREVRTTIPPGAYIGEDVFIGQGTVIEPNVVIRGPAWIGANCTIRSGCYVRENVLIGDGVMLGNSCEFKNCIVFDRCEIPHFSYVGDSILGFRAHLGAGVILSNVRLDRGEVSVQTKEGAVPTGLRKFGAIIGDFAEIGCNSVINPGSIIGRRSIVYPLSSVNGVIPASSILKSRQQQSIIARRD
jgi:NDP-sugar pyrophosphorylase family protein